MNVVKALYSDQCGLCGHPYAVGDYITKSHSERLTKYDSHWVHYDCAKED